MDENPEIEGTEFPKGHRDDVVTGCIYCLPFVLACWAIVLTVFWLLVTYVKFG